MQQIIIFTISIFYGKFYGLGSHLNPPQDKINLLWFLRGKSEYEP